MGLGAGAFDKGVGDHMGHLGGVGDHLVVMLRAGHGDAAEARGREQFFHTLQQGHIRVLRRYQYHGLPLVQVGPAVSAAPVLGARHGVAPQVGEAVLLRQGEARRTDFPLGAAAVDDDVLGGETGGHFRQPLDGRVREHRQ